MNESNYNDEDGFVKRIKLFYDKEGENMEKKTNQTWKIYILTLITFMVGTSQFCIAGILDKIAVAVGIPVSATGQLITIYALSNAIGTPIFMILTARMKQRKQLILSLIIILAGITIMLLLPGFTFMMISRAIVGVGAGIYVVTAYGIAAKMALPGRQGSAMSNVAMGASSSLVFGVPLGRIISVSYGWESIFWILEIFSILAMIVVIKIIPDMEPEINESGHGVNRLIVLKNPKIAVTLGITLLVFIGFSIVDTYITPFLNHTMPSLEKNISMILMILGIGSLIGSKLGGLLSDRIGVKRTIAGAIIFQAIFLVLASLLAKWAVPVIIALMFWEISCWTFGPTQNFNMVSLAPNVSGIALSLNSTFVQLGIAAGAGIGGIVVGIWSVGIITFISAVFAIVAMIVFWLNLFLSKAKIDLDDRKESINQNIELEP